MQMATHLKAHLLSHAVDDAALWLPEGSRRHDDKGQWETVPGMSGGMNHTTRHSRYV